MKKLRKNKKLIPLKTPENFETFGEKLLYSIGEPPSIVSKSASKQTADQLHIYLIRKGFFNNTVRDSIRYIDKKFLGLKKQRAEVYYLVEVKEPYLVKSVELISEDESLLKMVKSQLLKKLLQVIQTVKLLMPKVKS